MFVHTLLYDHTRQQWVINFTPLNILSPARPVSLSSLLQDMVVLAWLHMLWYSPLGKYSLLCFIGMCSAVWCVRHYVPHAIDHLLISFHLTSGTGISTSQDISLKNVMPMSMLRTIMDLLHCTWLVCKFGTVIRQCLHNV